MGYGLWIYQQIAHLSLHRVPSATASALLTLCVRTQALLAAPVGCNIHEAPSGGPKPPPSTSLAVVSARSSVTHVVLVVKFQNALHVSFAAEESAA
jgi:hypothetical protein